MKVCVQGLWHLGSVTAACLASLGHEVAGLDFDAETIDGLKQGHSPLFEPGLDELIEDGLDSGKLKFSSASAEAVTNVDVLWVTYDTPVDDDDRADVGFVNAQIEQTLPYLPVGATVLLSSQMPVGSIRQLEEIAMARYPEKGLGFACSPENLRLGKALDVFLKPDRIVVGVRSDRDREKLELLLRTITDRIEWMSVESAEMTKHAINAFLATSVTFANEIASVCEFVGADAKEVERGLKSESRIGPKAYLAPGGAFAGGTLARDVAFLDGIGTKHGLTTYLLSSVKVSNDEHKGWARRRLRSALGSLSGAHIAMWGLTYKPGTDTLRRSMAVELCDWLVAEGAEVRVHDPAVNVPPRSFAATVRQFDDPLRALEGAQALVVCTEWPLYREIRGEEVARVAPGLAVIDANRFLAGLAATPGIKYLAVGTPDPDKAGAGR